MFGETESRNFLPNDGRCLKLYAVVLLLLQNSKTQCSTGAGSSPNRAHSQELSLSGAEIYIQVIFCQLSTSSPNHFNPTGFAQSFQLSAFSFSLWVQSHQGGKERGQKGAQRHISAVLALLGQKVTSLSKGHVLRVTPEGSVLKPDNAMAAHARRSLQTVTRLSQVKFAGSSA